MNTELKLYRPCLVPAGVAWGPLKGDVVVPFVAANDDVGFEMPAKPVPLMLAAPKPRPKLSIV